MAKATSKTEMVEVTTVTLTMSEDAAFALHALASRGEDLDSDHPIYKGAEEAYRALSDLFVGGDTHDRRTLLYNSILVSELSNW